MQNLERLLRTLFNKSLDFFPAVVQIKKKVFSFSKFITLKQYTHVFRLKISIRDLKISHAWIYNINQRKMENRKGYAFFAKVLCLFALPTKMSSKGLRTNHYVLSTKRNLTCLISIFAICCIYWKGKFRIETISECTFRFTWYARMIGLWACVFAYILTRCRK